MSRLTVENLNFSYNMNTIYDSTSFTANTGNLTVIKGESGSGKSTFLDILSLKYGLNYNLFIDSKKIESISEIIDNIYYLKQNTIFAEDLTIHEQWIILKKKYNIDIDIQAYVNKLKLEDVQNLYPKQLSSGEKYRCLFINTLIIKPFIILMDEPTASLNDEYKEILIEIFDELKKNSILIVSSHDSFLIEKADNLYEISRYKLNNIRFCNKENEMCITNNNVKKVNWIFQFAKMKKHHLIKNIFTLLVISISIVLCCFSFHIDAGYISNLETQIENSQNNTILIFKSLDQREQAYDSDHSDCTYFPIDINEYNKIMEIDHISDIYPEIILYSHDVFETDLIPTFDIYNNKNECIYTYKTTVQEEVMKDIYTYTLYYENISEDEIDKYLTKKYKNNENGIYLNSLLLERCGLKSEDLENCYVKAQVAVPLYDVSGKRRTLIGDASNNGEEWIPANCWETKAIILRLPICGILTTGFEEDMRAYPSNALYLSRNYLLDIVEQYKPNYSYDEYFKEVDMEYVAVKNVDEATVIHKYMPWNVNSYNVIIDSSENLDGVVNELKSLGYSVEWKYNALKNYKESITNTKEVIQTLSISFAVVVIVIFAISFFIKDKKEVEFNEWLFHVGYKNKKDIYWIKLNRCLVDFLFVFISSLVMQIVFNHCMLYVLHTNYFVDVISIIVTVSVAFVTTLFVPMMWEVFNRDLS